MKKYDLCVIGAGSGGLVAATTAHRLGLKTVLLEKNKIGGECTHSGCVPSKAFIYAAKTFHASNEASRYGLPAYGAGDKFDFSRMMEHVNSIVEQVYANETPGVFEKMGIDVVVHPSGAEFVNNTTVRVGEDTIEAQHTVVCTGSSPRIVCPDGSQRRDFLNNENFWALREQPRSITFIGGGVISAELGQALRRFGSEVRIIDHNARILKVVDSDITEILMDQFREEGIELYPDTEVLRCGVSGGQADLTLQTPSGTQTLESDAVFLAIGRVPNTSGLHLDQAGVTYNDRGIQTDETLKTSAPNIYACGDVASPAKFTHAASYQADICVNNILNETKKKSDLRAFPWAIFTEPEIGHVGIGEAQAVRDSIEHRVLRVDANLDRFVTDGKTTGLLKVILDQDDHVIGADAIGAHAGEWIHILALAARNRLALQNIADTVFAYPTYSEIVKKAFTRYLRSKSQ